MHNETVRQQHGFTAYSLEIYYDSVPASQPDARHQAPPRECRRYPQPRRQDRPDRRQWRGQIQPVRPVARRTTAAWPRLYSGTDAATGGQLLRRLAHAPESGAGADVSIRPAAAG